MRSVVVGIGAWGAVRGGRHSSSMIERSIVGTKQRYIKAGEIDFVGFIRKWMCCWRCSCRAADGSDRMTR